MFRKGKALGEQGFFEKAEKVLEELKTQNAAGCVSFLHYIGGTCDSDP